MADLTRLLDLAQDVVDRCRPIVPSHPLVVLGHEADEFCAAEHDSDALNELADAIDDVRSNWQFWPQDEYESTMAEGPSMDALVRLQEAIEAVLEMESGDDE
jgi:hypothetical protein